MATLTQAQASNITAPTQFVATGVETYAYRRFGRGSGGAPPLLCLQHFTGTLARLYALPGAMHSGAVSAIVDFLQ